MTKLIYIGGYGHSGSTLLEYLMTANPKVVACGEIGSALRDRKKKRCTCRRRVIDCPIWGPFQISDIRHWSHEDLSLALLDHVGRTYEVMVDSSKTAWASVVTPFRFRRILREEIKLVHLVRDPRGVGWSLLKRAERTGLRPRAIVRLSLATMGWLVANAACEVFGWMYPDQYVRVRYEELSRSPREVMSNLFRDILLDGEYRSECIGSVDNRHQLCGNRMRSQKLSFAEIKEDDDWRNAARPVYLSLVSLLSWSLRGRYDYL
jgi:hypothetical protein